MTDKALTNDPCVWSDADPETPPAGAKKRRTPATSPTPSYDPYKDEHPRLLWTASFSNPKLGPVLLAYLGPTLEHVQDSCLGCPLLGDGCYAWETSQRAGLQHVLVKAAQDLRYYSLAAAIKRLRKRSKVARISAIGDPARVPHHELLLDIEPLRLRGFAVLALTHHWQERANQKLKDDLLASCNSLPEADQAITKGWKPTVVLPADHQKKTFTTPAGAKGIVCPEQTTPGWDCSNCGMCDTQHPAWNKVDVIGFRQHGRGQSRRSGGKRLPAASASPAAASEGPQSSEAHIAGSERPTSPSLPAAHVGSPNTPNLNQDEGVKTMNIHDQLELVRQLGQQPNGTTQQEVADRLEISTQTAKKRITKAGLEEVTPRTRPVRYRWPEEGCSQPSDSTPLSKAPSEDPAEEATLQEAALVPVPMPTSPQEAIRARLKSFESEFSQFSFDGLTAEISNSVEFLRRLGAQAFERWIRIGLALQRAKEAHEGEYCKWINEHAPFDRRQASNYTRFLKLLKEFLDGNSTSHDRFAELRSTTSLDKAIKVARELNSPAPTGSVTPPVSPGKKKSKAKPKPSPGGGEVDTPSESAPSLDLLGKRLDGLLESKFFSFVTEDQDSSGLRDEFKVLPSGERSSWEARVELLKEFQEALARHLGPAEQIAPDDPSSAEASSESPSADAA